MIAGTSTGAIIALGLALDVAPTEIVDLFSKHAGSIFPTRTRKKAEKLWAWSKKGPRYSQGPLKKALEDVFGERRLRDCNPPVVIPATTLDRFECRVFTTVARCGHPASPDADLLASEVALASAAAPLFFPAVKTRTGLPGSLEDPRVYVDGGVWANAPCVVAARYAHEFLGASFEEMRLLSVGNGEVPAGVIRVDFKSMRRAKMLEPILDMMFATQMELSERLVASLLGDGEMSGARMLRVNVSLKTAVALDSVEDAVATLPALAVREARNNADAVRRLLGVPVDSRG